MWRYKSYLWVISGDFNTIGTTKFCLAYQYCDCKDIKYSKRDTYSSKYKKELRITDIVIENLESIIIWRVLS